MTAIDCHWNHNGSVLAVAGCTTDKTNVVQFFSAYGEVQYSFYLNTINFVATFIFINISPQVGLYTLTDSPPDVPYALMILYDAPGMVAKTQYLIFIDANTLSDCRTFFIDYSLVVVSTQKPVSIMFQHIRTLRVPGGSMRALSWEKRSLRLAIAIDSFIYFANVKPDHKYAFYGNTLAFVSSNETVTFWDTATQQVGIDLSGALLVSPLFLVLLSQLRYYQYAKGTQLKRNSISPTTCTRSYIFIVTAPHQFVQAFIYMIDRALRFYLRPCRSPISICVQRFIVMSSSFE